MPKRRCPKCKEQTLATNALLFSDQVCSSCSTVIGVQRIYAALFGAATFVVTVCSSVAVLATQGMYAALLLLPLPIGAMSYLKARFSPLVVTQASSS